MANKVEYYHDSSWIDISDYILTASSIPRSTRNRDFTLKVNSIDITIATTLRDFLGETDFEFTFDDKLRFSIGSDTIFFGYVDKSSYDSDSMEFSVTIKSDISHLQDKLVSTDVLLSLFSTGSPTWQQYCNGDVSNNDLNNWSKVSVTWTLKKCFEACGYNLTIDSSIDDTILFTMPSLTTNPSGEQGGNITGWNISVQIKDLFFDRAALFVLNQYGSTFEDNNRITLFDLVSEICSSLGFYIDQTSADTFGLSYSADSYTVNADDKFKDQTENLRKTYDLDTISCQYSGAEGQPSSVIGGSEDYNQIVYASNCIKSTLNTGTPTIVGEGVNQVGYKTNFQILVSDAKNNETYYAPYYFKALEPAIAESFILNNNSLTAKINPVYRKIIEKTKNYIKNTILTNYVEETVGIVEKSEDMEWDNSEIVTETY